MKTLIDKVLYDRAGSALYVVLLLCGLVIQYGSIFELATIAPHPMRISRRRLTPYGM